MTNLVYKGLARNLAYENRQVLIFLFKWGLGQAGIANFANIFLIKCCWSLQNVMVRAFTAFELLTENQPWRKIAIATRRLGLINFS